MKSYLLTHLQTRGRVEAALCVLLPGQADPWLMLTPEGNPIAYLHLQPMDEDGGCWEVQADLSGRHFHRGTEVLQILTTLQSQVGGKVEHDV
jgi:hypothetical protein